MEGGDGAMEMEDDPEVELAWDKLRMIEWLQQFKRTQGLQEFIKNHKFSKEELAFLKLRLLLKEKKNQEKSAIEKWA